MFCGFSNKRPLSRHSIITKLWEYVKDIVYWIPVISFNELWSRIVAEILRVTLHMLKNMGKETEYGLDILRATNAS